MMADLIVRRIRLRGATPLGAIFDGSKPIKNRVKPGAPQQTDDGVLGVRRIGLRGATPLGAIF